MGESISQQKQCLKVLVYFSHLISLFSPAEIIPQAEAMKTAKFLQVVALHTCLPVMPGLKIADSFLSQVSLKRMYFHLIYPIRLKFQGTELLPTHGNGMHFNDLCLIVTVANSLITELRSFNKTLSIQSVFVSEYIH